VIKGKDGLGKTLQGYAQKLTAKAKRARLTALEPKKRFLSLPSLAVALWPAGPWRWREIPTP
jgi:hypothetical protein